VCDEEYGMDCSVSQLKPDGRSALTGERTVAVWAPQAIDPPLIRLSVVLPVHNEQHCLAQTIAAVLAYVPLHRDVEFIFVDDGSTDRTRDLLAQMLPMVFDRRSVIAPTRVRYLTYRQCRGKGHAVKQGCQQAVGEYICFLDGDLAYSLDHLEPLLQGLVHCDLVIGCRNLVDRQTQAVKPSRQLAGKIFNGLSQRILQLHFRDMQAGLKAFRRPVAQHLFSQIQTMGFAFDVELMYLAQKHGYTIGEIPAYLAPQHIDKPSKVKLFQDSVQMLFELFRIRYHDRAGRYD
jgi:dolichyl-phosphate beta-glucosyltransferase